MRNQVLGAGAVLLAAAGSGHADSGSFFKNLFNGGSGGGSSAPSIGAPMRAYDPNAAYCPAVKIADGAAAIRSYAGNAGDGSHLRHQITFGQMSRECTTREDGSLGVKVGVEVRAMLGPAGAPGHFDAPLTFSTQYNGSVLTAHARHVDVAVPTGEVQGVATVIDADLSVPADQVVGYEILVSLGGHVAKGAPKSAAKRRKPAATENASATQAVDTPQ